MNDLTKLAYAYGSLAAKKNAGQIKTSMTLGGAPLAIGGGLALSGALTGALGSDRGDTAEGMAAGAKNVISKGLKSGLGGAGVGLLLSALSRKAGGNKLLGALGGGAIGTGLGATAANIQNLAGNTEVGSDLGISNPHYEGHDRTLKQKLKDSMSLTFNPLQMSYENPFKGGYLDFSSEGE